MKKKRYEKLDKLADIFPSENIRQYFKHRSIVTFANDLDSIVGNNLQEQIGIDPKLFDESQKISGERYSEFYSHPEYGKLGIGTFVQDIVEDIQTFLAQRNNETKTTPKFRLYSGHDNTLGPLLTVLNIFDGLHPSMGSSVMIELYKKKNVDTIYFQILFRHHDGRLEVRKIPGCVDNICPLQYLLGATAKVIPKNHSLECMID